jgi:hypothetical protein
MYLMNLDSNNNVDAMTTMEMNMPMMLTMIIYYLRVIETITNLIESMEYIIYSLVYIRLFINYNYVYTIQ